MNREIKFRAWSNNSNKMMDWDFIESVRNLNKLLTLDHVIVMQYTGLKDKNGKEIYEGDVVWIAGLGTCQVLWSNMDFGYIFESADQSLDYQSIIEDFNSCEIKGNIYENPNLLT